MRTRKLRFLSALLAVAMMFMLTPTAAFAAITDITEGSETLPTNATKIENIGFTSDGKIILPSDTDNLNPFNVYFYPKNAYNGSYQGTTYNNANSCIWAITENLGSIAIRPGATFEGAGAQKISVGMTVAGNLNGGIYTEGVTVTDRDKRIGTITEGIFRNTVTATSSNNSALGGIIKGGIFLSAVRTTQNGKIEGGVFARDPGTTENTYTLKAPDCKIYTDYSYIYKDVDGKVYIENTTTYPEAYVVQTQADAQRIFLTVDSPSFKEWDVKINGVKKEYTDLSSDAKSYSDPDNSEIHVLEFTMPSANVEITPSSPAVDFALDDVGGETLPVYNGKVYMGNLSLDGWHVEKNAVNSSYPYTLTIKQNVTVDLNGNTINWAVRNYGTLKNGIVPGNLVNSPNTTGAYGPDIGAYGHVEDVAFKMNTNFGDQDSPISWVTLRNATACEGVFTDIVGVIGQQTLTVKPNVSEEHFKGWTYSGDVSDALAKQIDAQKDNYTMTLTLDSEAEDTLALTATTDGRFYAIDLWEGDGTASVNGTEVAAAAPGDRVTLTMDESKIPDGMTFDHWSISPEVEFAEGCKATDRTTTFIMPEQDVSVHANLRTDSDDGMDMATVVAGVAVGAGVAYLGYQVGTELYAKQILGDGVAIPRTRADVALTAWQLAGKPEVAIEGEPLSEAAMAQKWAVESGLMQNVDGSFSPDKKMSKIKALKVLDAAKKMG